MEGHAMKNSPGGYVIARPGRACAFLCMAAVLFVAGFAGASEDSPHVVPLTMEELDPKALDAARRYFAMPSMQGLSTAKHDPRVIARRVENALPEGIMTDNQREDLILLAAEELSDVKEEYDATTIRVLAHVYTAEELEALIAFEQTEAGRRIAEKRPIYSVLIKEATASLRRDALQRIIERVTGIKAAPEQ